MYVCACVCVQGIPTSIMYDIFMAHCYCTLCSRSLPLSLWLLHLIKVCHIVFVVVVVAVSHKIAFCGSLSASLLLLLLSPA